MTQSWMTEGLIELLVEQAFDETRKIHRLV